MDSTGPKGPNRPIIVYSLRDIVEMFGEPNAPVTRRTIQVDKNWLDAYHTQIERTIRGRSMDELSPVELRIVKLLLFKYFDSAVNYILKKHCK